ncbi:concanavalin A-like lectin/glucanase domain-containing protein [Lentinula raphanica]|nr:concanavalin A-like lectin/glucanase domain-containing protein [Lentinula raphanica]
MDPRRWRIHQLLHGNEWNATVCPDGTTCAANCALDGADYGEERPVDCDCLQRSPSTYKAGVKYGTGYCDSQCPRVIKFIEGKANVESWKPSRTSPDIGSGGTGICCGEMAVWEANSISAAVTLIPVPHKEGRLALVSVTKLYNPFRMGDTTSKFTVVTQFITSGILTTIRRLYIQNGKLIQNSMSNIAGVDPTNEITIDCCE